MQKMNSFAERNLSYISNLNIDGINLHNEIMKQYTRKENFDSPSKEDDMDFQDNSQTSTPIPKRQYTERVLMENVLNTDPNDQSTPRSQIT